MSARCTPPEHPACRASTHACDLAPRHSRVPWAAGRRCGAQPRPPRRPRPGRAAPAPSPQTATLSGTGVQGGVRARWDGPCGRRGALKPLLHGIPDTGQRKALAAGAWHADTDSGFSPAPPAPNPAHAPVMPSTAPHAARTASTQLKPRDISARPLRTPPPLLPPPPPYAADLQPPGGRRWRVPVPLSSPLPVPPVPSLLSLLAPLAMPPLSVLTNGSTRARNHAPAARGGRSTRHSRLRSPRASVPRPRP